MYLQKNIDLVSNPPPLPFVTNIKKEFSTGDPLHSRALAHSRAPLFTQPCPHCSHSRAPGEQWARLCVFTLQGCVQPARLCRGSPVFSLYFSWKATYNNVYEDNANWHWTSCDLWSKVGTFCHRMSVIRNVRDWLHTIITWTYKPQAWYSVWNREILSQCSENHNFTELLMESDIYLWYATKGDIKCIILSP